MEKEQLVIECYKKNPGRPLDCWREVEEFKEIAKKAESVRMISPSIAYGVILPI